LRDAVEFLANLNEVVCRPRAEPLAARLGGSTGFANLKNMQIID
jgi:hypothetical protein